nr:DUF885 family protein [Novosphingobium flavum]
MAWALPGAEEQLGRLCDKLWQEQLRRSPELATTYGADSGENVGLRGKLDDWSRGGRGEWVDWAKDNVKRLTLIDPTALPQTAHVNRAVLLDHYGKIARLGAKYRFGDGAASGPVSPYAISQLTGPYRAVPDMLEQRHAVANSADAEAWLARVSAFAGALDASTEAFRMDMGAGIVPPSFALDATLIQLGKLRGPEPAANSLAAALARKATAAGLAGDWGARAAAIVERVVYPAVDRQIAAVTAARVRATGDAGVWKLPQGQEFYADALAWQTASSLKPAEVHAMGREQVAAISAEMDALLGGLGLTQGTLAERMAALGSREGQSFPESDAGRAAVLEVFADSIARIRPRLPELFSALPPAALEVKRVPAALEQGSALAYAQGGSLDGTRPGAFFVNLQNVSEWPRFYIPTVAFHEGIPGHLWEGATASANPGIPAVRKRGTRYPAYAEGWALYVEQVVDEIGFYEGDPAGRLGYLQSQLFRSARLVVDTGIHHLRWTRDQAAAYMTQTTGQAASGMRREVERYCVTPGQACSYKVGQMEWLRLRALARRLAGSAFDLKHFHQLIELGRAPSAVMEEVVTARFNKRLSVLAMRTA